MNSIYPIGDWSPIGAFSSAYISKYWMLSLSLSRGMRKQVMQQASFATCFPLRFRNLFFYTYTGTGNGKSLPSNIGSLSALTIGGNLKLVSYERASIQLYFHSLFSHNENQSSINCFFFCFLSCCRSKSKIFRQ